MRLFMTFAAVMSLASTALASQAVTLINCTQKDFRPGAPAYSLSVVSAIPGSGQKDLYMLNKTIVGPNPPESIGVTLSTNIHYGKTTLITVDAGRSGYAHFYKNGDVSLVDINLFGNEQFNTGGPLTDYVCTTK